MSATTQSPVDAADASVERRARWKGRAADEWRRVEPLVYALLCMGCTLYAAAAFYGYMLVQTGGHWSAPLDDVFIHFDYARSFARGYPFAWSEGNGYSSGNTSLTYPIALALGYWLGFRQLNLMVWAACVACLGIFAFLLATGQLALWAPPGSSGPERRWMRFAIPPAVLSMGALDWTLFSGMETAFHLGVWGGTLAATLWWTAARSPEQARRRGWATGALGALLVATRPESAVCVAVFGVFGTWALWRSRVVIDKRGSAALLIAAGLPGVLFLVAHAAANHALTGEWSANGAIAKLFLNNPFMDGADKWERYRSLLAYIIPRLTHHHFSEHVPFGWLIPAMALVPLCSARLRPAAIMLWSQIVLWMLVVALNNQLRWHNERYAMPAVAWLLVLAALGVGTLLARVPAGKTLAYASYPYRVAAGLGIVALYWSVQEPRMKDQIWFFGRASRNILEQHVTAGRLLKELGAKRVLVGDAGAITYAADRPGLDLIGLGGYHAYPFARSTVHGLGASIELIERIPVEDRPDVMAIYPSWWGDLPIYFGHYLASVPVRGNVICGGSEKVIYKADWSPLDPEAAPRSLRQGERVLDELDVADLLSERQHDYGFPQPKMGFVTYRVLGDPDRPRRDLFDAGRIIPGGEVERFRMRVPPRGGRLIARVAPERHHAVEVRLDGVAIGRLEGQPRGGIWQELSLRLPDASNPEAQIELAIQSGDAVHYHLWVVEPEP